MKIPFSSNFHSKSKPLIGATSELLLFTFASCVANQSEACFLDENWMKGIAITLYHTKPPITSIFFCLELFSKASSAATPVPAEMAPCTKEWLSVMLRTTAPGTLNLHSAPFPGSVGRTVIVWHNCSASLHSRQIDLHVENIRVMRPPGSVHCTAYHDTATAKWNYFPKLVSYSAA